MKSFAWLFLAVLCSATLLNAKDKSSTTGWVCDSACVVRQGGVATCDQACNQASGTAVFVGDDGAISTISNQDVCSPHMNKHVRATFTPQDSQEQKDVTQAEQSTIRLDELRNETVVGGGGAGAGGGGR
jgi:hypothetical protein